jgi:uncharacterized protein (TIGR02271 family)
MFDRSKVREGMTVYSAEGDKLGKVILCDANSFTIEKGFFFPKDYIARYEDIAAANFDDDELRLRLTKDDFESRERGEGTAYAGSAAGFGAGSGATLDESARSGGSARTGDEVRVPVAEEELDVVKRDREAGEVRLHKDVVTDTRHVEVPVTREEVRVERVPASERTAQPGEASFREQDVSMPIREEEVEIQKRPVVKEEVRLQKERFTEQRAADADVRKERVELEGDEERRHLSQDRGGLTEPTSPGIAPRRDEDGIP